MGICVQNRIANYTKLSELKSKQNILAVKRFVTNYCPEKVCFPGAHGSWPTGDPRVAVDLSTVRVWQRNLAAGKLTWPLSATTWEGALRKGRGRGPIRNCEPSVDSHCRGWRRGDQRPPLCICAKSAAKKWLKPNLTFKVWIPALLPKL
eukprot:1707473-Amphidinium_carterae.2